MRRRSCSQIINKTTDRARNKNAKQFSYKVVVLGNSGTGKTWLIERLIMRQKKRAHINYYSDSPERNQSAESDGTIGVTFNLCKVRLIDSQAAETGYSSASRYTNSVLLHLWDTSGKPKYRNLVRNYIHDAHCIILVYNPAEGSEAAQRDLTSWYGFVKDATRKLSAMARGDSMDSLTNKSKKQTEQDLDALTIIVAISSGTCAFSLSETAMSGVNFGRVFASSVCGRFYLLQRPSSCLMPHRCQNHHADCIQQSIRHRLTPQLLAEVLLHFQQSRQHRRERQLKKLDTMPQRQPSLLMLSSHAGDDKALSKAAGRATSTDDGCFWCRRIFGCRRRKPVAKA